MEAVPGVEALDVFTPYRFRLAVGRAFHEDRVRADVEGAVVPADPPAPSGGPPGSAPALPADRLAGVKGMLAKVYPFWAVAVTPDGRHHALGGRTADEVRAKVSGLEGARAETSWGGP
jgi:hypothetical protein